jgi:hypothetical protein
MIVIESTNVIVSVNALSEEEKNNLKAYFETHPECHIIDMGNGRFCTYKQICDGIAPENLCVEYGPDMFLFSMPLVVRYGYAIGRGKEGEYLAVLKQLLTPYVHAYTYSGGVDMWFINQYDCIFLMGCNELSVELVRAVMQLWTGDRLVMVGKDWENLIPMLPDLPGKECFYEEALDEDRLLELTAGKKPLYVNTGIPHEEPMDRYEQGIMTYDEIMSFLFLFSDYRNPGEENPDKNFFVVDAYYGDLGLFALFDKAECVARYAKSRGFIPVIRIQKAGSSFYSDFKNDDIWGKFYNQPEGYTIEEVLRSKHVCFAPCFYNGSIQSNLMNRASNKTTLSWPDGIYNSRVTDYLHEKEKIFLPYPDKTLGVLARGTDYVNTHLHNHAIHASKEMICEKIDELRSEREELAYIYLATEDADYCEYFKDRYGEKIYFTDQKRFVTKPGEMLAEHHRADKEKSDGFTMGVEYILSIYLLSKCNSLIASGGCAGVGEAIKENGGQYKSTFVFDLGKNTA